MSKTASKTAANSQRNPADHLKQHRFKPGQSGNPRGRPKKVVDVEEKALENAEKALEKLITLMGSADEKVALQAAQQVLDRAVGKATQPTADVTSSHEEKLRELEDRYEVATAANEDHKAA
ncbi:MAG: DUF5681 domain-containing protein [Filomicrobium sp.]